MTDQYDLVIRAGSIYDGTGAKPFRADVGLRGGRIAAIGAIPHACACGEFDVDGAIVTPGFVDIHTHYDGQVTWESGLSSSSDRGVTIVVTGNCGVGFAPCRESDRKDLIESTAGVEDLPEVVMAEGLAWNWRSFPDCLAAVDARPHDSDIAAMIPHSALRVFVMRERAFAREIESPPDIDEMAKLAGEAMSSGAIGFATSRALQQRSIKGLPRPSCEGF